MKKITSLKKVEGVLAGLILFGLTACNTPTDSHISEDIFESPQAALKQITYEFSVSTPESRSVLNPADYKDEAVIINQTSMFSQIFASLLRTNISTISDLKYEETYDLSSFVFDPKLFDPFVANIEKATGANVVQLTQFHKILLSKVSSSKVTMKLYAGVFGDGKFFDSVIYLTLEEANGKVNTTIQFYSQNPSNSGEASVLDKENDTLRYSMYDYETFINTENGMEGISNYCGQSKSKTVTKENALLTYLAENFYSEVTTRTVQKNGMTYSTNGYISDSAYGTVLVGDKYTLPALNFKGTVEVSGEFTPNSFNSVDITITLEGEEPVSIKDLFEYSYGANGSPCLVAKVSEDTDKYWTVKPDVAAKISACMELINSTSYWSALEEDVNSINEIPNDAAIKADLTAWLKTIIND